jgi:FkbM family methyltransferase
MGVIDTAGVKFFADGELEAWRAEQLLTKEPETIAWLDHHARLGGAFYDIGANIGSYALYAARVNPELSVFAFEPVAVNFLSLLRNVHLNECKMVHAFHAALSRRTSLAQLFIKDARVGSSGAQLDVPSDEQGHRFEPLTVEYVMSFSLDDLVHTIGFPPPSFVKIDVDGREKDIVEGMSRVLRMPGLRSILIEFNSRPEQAIVQQSLLECGLEPDPMFNDRPNHSRHRRDQKNSTAANMVFTRSAG